MSLRAWLRDLVDRGDGFVPADEVQEIPATPIERLQLIHRRMDMDLSEDDATELLRWLAWVAEREGTTVDALISLDEEVIGTHGK